MTETRTILAVPTAGVSQSPSSEAKLTTLGTPTMHQAGFSGISGLLQQPQKWVLLPHFNQEEAGAQRDGAASSPTPTKGGNLVAFFLHRTPS